MAPDIERHSVGLLEWLYDNRGDGSTVPPIDGYLTESGLPENDGYSVVQYLADRDLVKNCSTFGQPGAYITSDGMAWVQRLRAARTDPTQRVHRVSTLRTRMLLWLDEPENGKVADWSGFLASPSAVYQDVPFTEDEVNGEADYLSRKGLISALNSWGMGAGLTRPRLTASGRDCITDHGGNVSDYLSRGQGGGNTTNNITMTGSTGNITVASENVVQNVNAGLDATKLLDFAGFVRQTLPTLGLGQDEQTTLDAQAEELHEEASTEAPDRGKLRRLLDAIMDGLREAAPTVVQSTAIGLGEEALKAITGA